MKNSLHNGSLIKQTINSLSNRYKIDDIESAIIEMFLEKKKIRNVKNKLIQERLQYSKKTNEIKFQLNKVLIELDLKTIERIFELLIPAKDRKTNGAFYTPNSIVQYIVAETIKEVGYICDPSCGSGAFLVESVKKIRELTGKSIISIIEKYIYGCDILDYAVRRAKLILSLLALENKEDKENIKFNIICGDSLLLNWKKRFPHIVKSSSLDSYFSEEFKAQGFDIILGNPPYLRIQDLSEETKNKLRKKWDIISSGNFNIYFAFFELAKKLVKRNGRIGYIVPNNFFTSLAALKLRKWMQKHQIIEKIIDFNHLQIFEDVTTYTCIVILRNSKKSKFQYALVDKLEQVDSLCKLTFSTIKFADLNPKKWRLMNEVDFANIKKIENIGVPLGKMTSIRSGLATLKDSIYFVDSSKSKGEYYIKKYKNHEYLIEKEITRKIVKISTVKTNEDIINNTLRIIYPYERTSNNSIAIIPEAKLRKKYPKCYEYLISAKEELLTRDKGKRKYIEWYAYGRGQGLDMHGIKILTPTFSKKPRFLIDWDEDSFFCNGYGIFVNSSKRDVIVLQKILNSKIMEYYIYKTSVLLEGGYPCFQKNFIELFSIPHLTEEEKNMIYRETNISKIDEFLIKKYGVDL